jgi:hypothetical protein
MMAVMLVAMGGGSTDGGGDACGDGQKQFTEEFMLLDAYFENNPTRFNHQQEY